MEPEGSLPCSQKPDYSLPHSRTQKERYF